MTKKAKAPKAKTPKADVIDPRRPAHGLTTGTYSFCLSYLANGFNGAQAYLSSHPGVTYSTAMTEGSRLLRNHKVRAFLAPKLEAAWKPLQMGGEEALARIGQVANFDLGLLFDTNGNLLPIREWPEGAGQFIESIDASRGKVKLPSRLIALRTILEATGKVSNVADSIEALAAAMKADRERT